MQHVTEDPTEAGWFGRETPDEDRARAHESPAALLAATEGLRAPPAVAAEVLRLTRDPKASFVDLRVALEQDPAICAQLVRVANTAAYATRVRCGSVDDAVMRLGTNRVRSVAAGLVALGAFDRECPESRAIRRHSARVGALAELLGREQRSQNASDLFLVGIVHDIGKLAFMESGSLDYVEAPEEVLAQPERSHPWERAQTGFDHAALGAAVLESWMFPEWIAQVVDLHHDPAAAYEIGGDVATSVTLLRLADHAEHAIASGEEAPWSRLAHEADAQFLELSEDVLEARWGKLAAAVEDVGAVFG